jgi:ABC-type dipeptide/oligopeptide/nickel transport system permease subunit
MTRDSSSGFCLPTTNPFPTTGIASSSSLTGLILSIIKFLLFFSGIVAVLFLIIGGFLYMSSGGNEEQAEKGKKTITNFALGLAVIIMAYAIVTILGNTLTDNNFNVTSSGGSSITTGSGN